jgi:hypothetical protein
LGVHLSANDVVAFELPQPLRQHFLRRSRKQLLQLAETASSALEIKQDQRLPFATDDFAGDSDGAIGILHKGLSLGTGLQKGAFWREGDFSLIFPDRPPELNGNGESIHSCVTLDAWSASGEERP